MKTKITTILMILAASVFAFAETSAEAQKPAPEKAQCCKKEQPCKACKQRRERRPQISAEQRDAHVQRLLLSLSDEDLAKLAERVAAVQKMTAEEKAEALKALPKPEFRPGQNRGPQPQACGQGKGLRDGKGAPKARGPHFGPRGNGNPADCPPPPPPPPAQDDAPAADGEPEPAAE